MPRKARDVMTSNPECIGEDETIVEAAKKMAELNVGALPICGTDRRLKGMLTDRDIVVNLVASGKDPGSARGREVAQGEAGTIGADDSGAGTVQVMAKYKVRRLPVIDGHDLVGIIALADIAQNVDDDETGEVLQAISSGG